MSEIGKLAVGAKLWRLVANPVEVDQPGLKLGQAGLVVLGVDEGEAGEHSGTSRQICPMENLKKLDIDVSL